MKQLAREHLRVVLPRPVRRVRSWRYWVILALAVFAAAVLVGAMLGGVATEDRQYHERQDGWVQKQQRPRWLRDRYVSFAPAGITADGGLVLDLATRDIDVSDGGGVWFHLFGPRCLDQLPTWGQE